MEPDFNNAEYVAHVSGLAEESANPDIQAALRNYAQVLERIRICLDHRQMFIPTDAMRSILTHGKESQHDRSLTYDDYLLSAKFYKDSFL